MPQYACLVFTQITVDNYVSLFTELHASGSGVRHYDGPDIKFFILVDWGRSFFVFAWPTGIQLVILFYFRLSVMLFNLPWISAAAQHDLSVESFLLLFAIYLFYCDDLLSSKGFARRTEQLT